jgi:hypothetical protein
MSANNRDLLVQTCTGTSQESMSSEICCRELSIELHFLIRNLVEREALDEVEAEVGGEEAQALEEEQADLFKRW